MKLISGKSGTLTVGLSAFLASGLLAAPPTIASDAYEVVATVPVGSSPWGIAISPDGSRVYVGDYSSSTISVVNTTSLARTTIGVGGEPAYIALTPDGTTAYAPSYRDDSVAIVDLTASSLAGAFTGTNNAWAVAINGDDSLFVFDFVGVNAPVRRVNLHTGLEDDSVTTSSYAWSATISADGSTLYAPLSGANKLAVVRTSDMSVTAEIPMLGDPRYAAVSPDQASVYVTSTPISGAPMVVRVNTATRTIDDSWVIGPTSYRAFGIATSLDGAQIYVAMEAPAAQPGQLVVIDAATGQVDDTVSVGVNPFGVAVSPSGDRVYVTNNLGNSLSIISAPTPSPPAPTPVAPPVAANPPRDVTAAPGDASASVSWVAPASSGSFPVTNYQATSSPGGRTCLVAAPALSCEIGGLTNGTAYTFTARALTGAGWSSASEPSNAVTPRAVPRPSVVISGSRDGREIQVSGTATGLGMGAILKPWVRLTGQTVFAQGSADILVSMDGTFDWSRRSSKRLSVYVQTPDGSQRSNTVIIPAR